ncbi:L-threonylcarbamoyladenylate synthase [Streptococcus ferus]|uniref:L-threonylcarbamoyladenylate synthase n=1 Tax=Streptococcus ferus TaxID=1345 RepID=UPI0035A09FBF
MDKLAHALGQGQAVILPTETVYGLFAKALDKKAVEAVYQLKHRPQEKAMNLNVASLQDILRFSKNPPTYLADLVDAFLPGPLTLILQANDQVPLWINSGKNTVGFRIPNHAKTLDYIKRFGPLIGPSANISGQKSGQYFHQIKNYFPEIPGIEDDMAIQGVDSTILDISGDRAKILRQGIVTKEQILDKIKEIRF